MTLTFKTTPKVPDQCAIEQHVVPSETRCPEQDSNLQPTD